VPPTIGNTCRYSYYSNSKAVTTTILRESSTGTGSTKTTLSASGSNNNLSSLTVEQLEALLRQQGLKVGGDKSELIERLSGDVAEQRKKEQIAMMFGMAKKLKREEEQTELETIPSSSLKNQGAVAVENGEAKAKENATRYINMDNAIQREDGFQEINVPASLAKRLDAMGIMEPTPIQWEAIPLALEGNDVMGVAQTGTGKTLAFAIPLISQMMKGLLEKQPKRKPIRGLVLAPTRELANQIEVQLKALTQRTPIKTCVVVGGKNMKMQIENLKSGTDLLVATPGRLLDLMDRGALSLAETSFLVLDEADLMLDMGFLPDLRKIAKMLPEERQTMLFSATMSKDMNQVAKDYLKNPVRIEIARAGTTADKIAQEIHFLSGTEKMNKLITMLSDEDHQDDRAIVFSRTKHGIERLSKKLIDNGIKAASIHGNKSQLQRDQALAAFKAGEIKVLVATDVAARGLDIPDVKRVYNFELPNLPEAYVHRIGRTARAGKEGIAISFCTSEEMKYLKAIQKFIKLDIPVASGIPVYPKRKVKQEKDRVKANEHIQERKPKEKKKKKKEKKQGGRGKQEDEGGNNNEYKRYTRRYEE